MQIEYLFAAIAFALLMIVFGVHYRKMVQLEKKEDDLQKALALSEKSKKKLQASMDKLLESPLELLTCLQASKSDEEMRACITRLMGEVK